MASPNIGSLTIPPTGTLIHQGLDERINMNKYHLLWIIERLQKHPGPRLEHVAIPAAIAFSVLLALVPADFKDYLGISSAVWESIAWVILVGSAIATVLLFLWWLYNLVCHPTKTPIQVVEEIIDQMAKDKERLAHIMQRQENDIANSQSGEV